MRTHLKNFRAARAHRRRRVGGRRGGGVVLVLAAICAALVTGCGGSGTAGGPGGKLNVVAAEDFWGSIAEQVGGDRVVVTNVITNPAADPHDYEPTANDGRAFASSQVSIVNGIGYDEWASKLLDANADGSRVEVSVGDVLGLKSGDNPHQWYSPESVEAVTAAIVTAFEEADPGHDSYYEAQAKKFDTQGLADYHRMIAKIKGEFGGTMVGASESIFEPLAPALGLDLITPTGFMDAVAEGTEPSPSDKAAADHQLVDRAIGLWVYNSQNATPDVKRLNEAAEANDIPIATVTETLTPEGASFQAWMVKELEGIDRALKEGAGGSG